MNDFPRSSRDTNTTNNERFSLLEGSSSSLINHNEFLETAVSVDIISEDVEGEDQQQILTQHNVKGTSRSVDLSFPGMKSGGPTGETQHESNYQRVNSGHYDANSQMRYCPTVTKQILNTGENGDDFHVLLNDFALFDSSSIGVYEFSREFLAIVRRHRLQPKARAILLDLLQRIMPENNRCPKTIAEMRKLVACNERAYIDLFRENSDTCAHLVSRFVSDTIRPQSHYLLPQQPSSIDDKSFKIKRSRNPDSSSLYHHGMNEYLETGAANPTMMVHHPDELSANTDLLPHILQTIDRLSQEVALLRMNISTQSHGSSRRFNRRSVFSSDERAGIHIYDVSDDIVLLNSLTRGELQRTIDISRYDENRLIYDNNDITEIVLEKIELSPYLHNPSLCGRMVADILFSREYLSNKHILAEGQSSSRARLELLPSGMTHLFYGSLRKLGVSRIVEEDREHWLYLARDGVNQRARDLKANRKRKFYTDDHSPVFADE